MSSGSGRFQREDRARHRTQPCDSRLRYFELSGGILPQKGLLIAVRQGMRDLGVWAHLSALRGMRLGADRVTRIRSHEEITDRARELTVSSMLSEPSSVLVAIKDMGAGLDPAVAERMFQPFFTTKRDGLGMGLAICRSIIETHGGRLWAAPRYEADIRFTIPLRVDH